MHTKTTCTRNSAHTHTRTHRSGPALQIPPPATAARSAPRRPSCRHRRRRCQPALTPLLSSDSQSWWRRSIFFAIERGVRRMQPAVPVGWGTNLCASGGGLGSCNLLDKSRAPTHLENNGYHLGLRRPLVCRAICRHIQISLADCQHLAAAVLARDLDLEAVVLLYSKAAGGVRVGEGWGKGGSSRAPHACALRCRRVHFTTHAC